VVGLRRRRKMMPGMNPTSTPKQDAENYCDRRELQRSAHVAQRENITTECSERPSRDP
jgi:hypothetical protein